MTDKRILLADDDRLVLSTLMKDLKRAGYQVQVAESGEEALACAEKGQFDLAILDIRMGGISGIETARQLMAVHDIPSLFLSAYSDEAQVQQAVNSGALGYVVKPVDAMHLIPAVEAALARARDFTALITTKDQLEFALNRGRKTSMAIGILMERRGIDEKTAFETLRSNARSNNRKLEDLSVELVEALERLNAH